MSRYQQLFTELSANNEGAFIPFVTIGDPGLEASLEIIKTLVENGADALELGFPFSDPAADGPVIQGANLRALNAGVTPDDCFALIAKVRALYPQLPIGLLVYANLVYAKDIDGFYAQCQQVGVDSVLVADVPLHESKDFRDSANKHDVAPIFIAPPQATQDTLEKVAQYGKGYTYLLSRAGVTGTHSDAGLEFEAQLELLNQLGAAPSVLGFGISNPEQVQTAITKGAAGAISGSAVVKIIEANKDNQSQLLNELAAFISAMKQATKA
ncbi:tryptophan synthase subunit alpha [Paraferrimonas sp. SM1919]|uniref:tryptophan synthase subunit alpha n=1 Tax=Paraferrimonas sp. SM1919 TaxID=2662263 RepID=UPI0013D2E744|nr:tryptophan synthase subunit alpha [Paraferrimonas sp. SM1919]